MKKQVVEGNFELATIPAVGGDTLDKVEGAVWCLSWLWVLAWLAGDSVAKRLLRTGLPDSSTSILWVGEGSDADEAYR